DATIERLAAAAASGEVSTGNAFCPDCRSIERIREHLEVHAEGSRCCCRPIRTNRAVEIGRRDLRAIQMVERVTSQFMAFVHECFEVVHRCDRTGDTLGVEKVKG